MDHVIQKRNDNSNVLSLEFAEEYFADIIVNFLGSKEKVSYESDGSFLLRINDLEQLHYLLEEKIAKEQYTYINNFLIRINYND